MIVMLAYIYYDFSYTVHSWTKIKHHILIDDYIHKEVSLPLLLINLLFTWGIRDIIIHTVHCTCIQYTSNNKYIPSVQNALLEHNNYSQIKMFPFQ